MSPGSIVFVIWLLCVVVGLIIHHSPQQRRKREQRALEQARQQQAVDQVLARQWLDAVARHEGNPGRDMYLELRTGLAFVSYVYGSYPYRGTKAILIWYRGGQQDAWFELAWPQAGQWLLVRGSSGYGPHSDNPKTFYARIVGVVPVGAFEAWQRQAARGQLPASHVQQG